MSKPNYHVEKSRIGEQGKVDFWNANYQVGQKVNVTKDDGSSFNSATKSEAWMVCGIAVILVDGIVGGYKLDRVRAV